MAPITEIYLEEDFSEIANLPWDKPLLEWVHYYSDVYDGPKGVSRHNVIFVNTQIGMVALKESNIDSTIQEYELLRAINDRRLPAVIPVGYISKNDEKGYFGILITRYLEYSLPYLLLFQQASLKRYRENLLDAMASLLVQMHLSGIFWGDCSLSNTLFKRDAGALQAYLVDAETVEVHNQRLTPELRSHELDIMEFNLTNDIDKIFTNLLTEGIPVSEISAYVRLRYQQIWEEISKNTIIQAGELYQIQEHIRSLNKLGFSVGRIDLDQTTGGSQLQMRVIVTDRNYHRDQLHSLTGIFAQEHQAQKIINEIVELRAVLSASQNRNVPMSIAAYHWFEDLYKPTIEKLGINLMVNEDPTELYCQVLEHKWFLSERVRRDVGHQTATDDFISYLASHGKL